jgi:hypothetical protein
MKPQRNDSSPVKESQSLPNDEMTEVLSDVIFRMHLDHNQEQPTKANEMLMLISWRDHMAQNGIPWNAVPLLYNEAVKSKAQTTSRGFMPTIGEIIHEWQNALESGYWEKQNAPEVINAPALPPGNAPLAGGINTDKAPQFVKAFAQLAAVGGAVTCHCDGDKWCHKGKQAARLVESNHGMVWVCAQNKCAFQHDAEKVMELASAAPSPIESEPLQAREYSDDELVTALRENCNIDDSLIERGEAIRFAQWMLGVIAPDFWTPAMAESEWSKMYLCANITESDESPKGGQDAA